MRRRWNWWLNSMRWQKIPRNLFEDRDSSAWNQCTTSEGKPLRNCCCFFVIVFWRNWSCALKLRQEVREAVKLRHWNIVMVVAFSDAAIRWATVMESTQPSLRKRMCALSGCIPNWLSELGFFHSCKHLFGSLVVVFCYLAQQHNQWERQWEKPHHCILY